MGCDPGPAGARRPDGVERDEYEVLVGEVAAVAKEWLAQDPRQVYALLAGTTA